MCYYDRRDGSDFRFRVDGGRWIEGDGMCADIVRLRERVGRTVVGDVSRRRDRRRRGRVAVRGYAPGTAIVRLCAQTHVQQVPSRLGRLRARGRGRCARV